MQQETADNKEPEKSSTTLPSAPAEKKKSVSGCIWRIFKKTLKYTLCTALFVFSMALLLLSFVLFTNTGSSFAWGQVTKYVPEISGDFADGDLSSGFIIKNFKMNFEDSIVIEAADFQISYSIWDLLKSELKVEYLGTSDMLLVLGNKPLNMPAIDEIISSRLYENHSFEVNDAGAMTRTRPSVPDKTLVIMPAPDVHPAEPEPEEEDDGERFVLDMPVKIIIDKISISRFLMLSNIIDVAVEKCEASATMEHTNLYVNYLTLSYADSLLHGEDRDELLARRTAGEEITYSTLEKIRQERDAVSADDGTSAGDTVAEGDNAEKKADEAFAPEKAPVSASSSSPASETADTQNISRSETVAAASQKSEDAGRTEEESGEQVYVEPESPLKNPYDRKEIKSRIEPLYTVILPFDLYVEKVEINKGRYHMDGFDTGIFDGGFKMEFVGPKVNVSYLSFNQELGHARLAESWIILDEYYPIKANLTADSANPDWFGLLANHKVTITVDGDLVDLNAHALVSGVTDADIQIRSNVLAPHLPFTTDIQVEHARWPVTGDKADYALKKLNLKADGSLKQLALELKTDGVEALNYPELKADIALSTDFHSANISRLEVVSSAGDKVSLKGNTIWSEQYSFDGSLDLKITDIANYLPDYLGDIELGITSYLHYQDFDNWYARFSRLQAKGSWMGYPLKLSSGKIEAGSSWQGIVEKLHAEIGDSNNININGSMTNRRLDLSVLVDLHNISLIHPDFYGKVSGEIKAKGDVTSPEIDLKASVGEFLSPEINLANVNLSSSLKLKELVLADGVLNLGIDEVRKGDSLYASGFSLKFAGNEGAHTLELSTESIAGYVEMTMKGGLKDNRSAYSGDLEKLHLARKDLDFSLSKPLSFGVKFMSSVSAWFKAHEWQVNGNSILVSDGSYSPDRTALGIRIPSLDLMKFSKYLPEGMVVKKPLAINADIALNRGNPDINVEFMESDNGIIFNKQLLEIEKLGLKVNLKNQQLTTDLKLLLGKFGSVQTVFRIDNLSSTRNLSGDLHINRIDLELIKKFVDELHDSDGFIDGHGRYAGTLAKPLFYGQITTENMDIYPAADIGLIDDINTMIDISGDRADINASFTFNAKKGTIKGNVVWDPEFEATLKVDTEELPLDLLGYGKGVVQVNLEAFFNDKINKISGKIRMPQARINVKELPESSVSASSDIVEVHRDENGIYKDPDSHNAPVMLKVDVELGPDIKINALGLRTYLKGLLNVRQRPRKAMNITGKIELVDGTFHAYGQNLLIEQGMVSFVGDPTAPTLDIRAIRNPHSMQDENVTVGIKVSGNAHYPKIDIFSRPEMSQSEALSYLLRGKGLDQTNGSGDMATQLFLGVGLMQTNNVIGNIGESVGLEDMTLDSRGEGDDTQVEVSAYIMPKIQIAYGYGLYNAVSEFRIRYEMFPRFYIEATSSIEQAVDAVYKLDFDF